MKGYDYNRIRDSARYVTLNSSLLELQLQPNDQSRACQQFYSELATTQSSRSVSRLRETQLSSSSLTRSCLFDNALIPPQLCLFIARVSDDLILTFYPS